MTNRVDDALVTEEMLQAGYRATGCPVSEHGPGPRNREFFTQIYLAMHGAALEAAGVAELREALSYSADDWAALSRIIETNIKETDGPDRVRWDGVWHEGPLATAYLETLRAIKEMADRNIAALANQGKAQADG